MKSDNSIEKDLLIYKNISNEYHKSKYDGWRLNIELYSILKYLPDKNGKILEMACGTGFYTKFLIRKYGIDNVKAFDYVPEMIEKAKEIFPDNKIFFVADACSRNIFGSFSFIFAAYLLNYCSNRKQLQDMLHTIYINLEDNGLFLTINDNPNQNPNNFHYLNQYGFTKNIPSEPKDKTDYIPVEYIFPSFTITNYRCPFDELIKTFQEVGFKNVETKKLICKENIEFYDDFLTTEPIIIISAMK